MSEERMKGSDSIRGALLTKFVCAECGSLLNLSYEIPKSKYIDGEPTGAAMVSNAVAVYPCQSCLAKYKKVSEALKIVLDGV